MLTYFFRLATLVNNGDTTLEQAVDAICHMLTDDEHLALLQGGWSLTRYLSDNAASPYPASAVPRLGIPGFHIVDGVRQYNFTEFPSPLARAASFNSRLEERIVRIIPRRNHLGPWLRACRARQSEAKSAPTAATYTTGFVSTSFVAHLGAELTSRTERIH